MTLPIFPTAAIFWAGRTSRPEIITLDDWDPDADLFLTRQMGKVESRFIYHPDEFSAIINIVKGYKSLEKMVSTLHHWSWEP